MNPTTKSLFGSLLVVTASLISFASAPVHAETKLRVTLDTGPTHVRNQSVKAFAAELKSRSGGALTAEIFESGQLYSSRDAAKAVARGDVDLAIVASPALSRVDADLNVLDLPMFSGMTPEQKHVVVDGPLGQALSAQVAKKLGVVVPGHWYVLGELNTYSTKKPITSFDDFKGLKVRIPGGAALVSHFRTLGADPAPMPFSDVPLALQQGVVDAMVSSNASIVSAKLTDAGIRNAFIDRIDIGYYVPIVSSRYWNKLSAKQQALFSEVWNKYADQERVAAIAQQREARTRLEKIGVHFVEPSADAAKAVHQRLLANQAELVKKLEISQSIMDLAKRAAQ